MAIIRYLARKHGLHAKSEMDLVRLELAEGQTEDLRLAMIPVSYDLTIPLSKEDHEIRKVSRLAQLPGDLQKLSKFLGDRTFLVGDYLTYVDFILYDAIDFHLLLAKDDNLIKAYPNLAALMKRIENLPRLKEFFTSERFSRLPLWRPEATWGGQA